MFSPIFTLLTLTLAISACDGSSAAGAPDSAGKPAGPAEANNAPAKGGAVSNVLIDEGGLCELLPLDQIEIALGKSAVSAEASKSSLGLGHSCRVVADDQTLIDINRSDIETLDEFKVTFDKVGLTDETVDGLGEFAYRAPGTALGGPGARLAVYTGERHIGVTVYAEGTQATMFDASEAIVRALLEQGL
jgi:hypothetical protein